MYILTLSPVWSGKFVSTKHWVVAGADGVFIRVYNKVNVLEAHTNHISALQSIQLCYICYRHLMAG